MAWSKDDTMLASGSRDYTIIIWSAVSSGVFEPVTILYSDEEDSGAR